MSGTDREQDRASRALLDRTSECRERMDAQERPHPNPHPSGEGVWVEAVGIAAPGLANWQAAREILRGDAPYTPTDLPPHAPQLLPPNERRAAHRVFGSLERDAHGLRRATSFVRRQ